MAMINGMGSPDGDKFTTGKTSQTGGTPAKEVEENGIKKGVHPISCFALQDTNKDNVINASDNSIRSALENIGTRFKLDLNFLMNQFTAISYNSNDESAAKEASMAADHQIDTITQQAEIEAQLKAENDKASKADNVPKFGLAE